MKKHKKYTQEEILFLKNNYSTMNNRDIAVNLGRDTVSVRNRATRLGLRKKEDLEVGENFGRLTITKKSKSMLTSCICGGQSTAGCQYCKPVIVPNQWTPANPDPTNLFPVSSPKGWECPKCTRVYAPSCAECLHCNSKVNT